MITKELFNKNMKPLLIDKFYDRWYLHPYYENYLFSLTGKVKNLKTNYELKPSKNDTGYYYVKLFENGKIITRTVHRLILEAVSPLNLYEYEVNHINFNKKDNSILNLEWVSRKENLNHFFKYGNKNTPKGSRQPKAKLHETNIQEIFDLYKKGLTLKEISVRFNVTITTIQYILKRKTWKHVEVQ